ncbi:hypothetical protein C8Q79DRAFT_1015041 [Trametes meyenii]|nr:hypothetical protein C8Q79DRAFT_1015041 [Trametes meyenii]
MSPLEYARRVVFGKRKRPRPQPDAHHLKRTFEREKVVEKAKALFEVYDRLLDDHSYFMGSQSLTTPTTLDVVFAVHTHMLLNLPSPPCSNPTLASSHTAAESFLPCSPHMPPRRPPSSMAGSRRLVRSFPGLVHDPHTWPPRR